MLSKSFWDRLGIGLSGLCAIHCLALPVFIAILPLYPVAEHVHSWTHPLFLCLIIPTVYFSIRYRDTPKSAVIMMLCGLSILVLAWGLHDWFSQNEEAWVTLGGSIFLIAGHWVNYKSHPKSSMSNV